MGFIKSGCVSIDLTPRGHIPPNYAFRIIFKVSKQPEHHMHQTWCARILPSVKNTPRTYLRFVLLSILEFWNTVHDFPSIIYHSPESWPSVSSVWGQEEKRGSVLFKFHHPTEKRGNEHNSLQKLKLLHRWEAGLSTKDHRSTLIWQNIHTSRDLSLAQNKRKKRKTERDQLRALNTQIWAW